MWKEISSQMAEQRLFTKEVMAASLLRVRRLDRAGICLVIA